MDLKPGQTPLHVQVYGKLSRLTDSQKLLFLTPGAHPFRYMYDTIVEKDPTVDYNADTPRKQSILRATNQWDPKVNKSIRPM